MVSTVSLTAGGSGYTSQPLATISGGGGSGATATATLTGMSISGVTLTASGSGYTATPAVTFVGGGGTSAVASAQIAQGVLTSITVTNGGAGYTSPPTVTVSGGGSSTTATAILSGAIVGITLTYPGYGYGNAPVASIIDPTGSGSGATASASAPLVPPWAFFGDHLIADNEIVAVENVYAMDFKMEGYLTGNLPNNYIRNTKVHGNKFRWDWLSTRVDQTSPVPLPADPITVTSGSGLVTLDWPNHGASVGDTVWLQQVIGSDNLRSAGTASGTIGGIAPRYLNQPATIIGATSNTISFFATSNVSGSIPSAATVTGGGPAVQGNLWLANAQTLPDNPLTTGWLTSVKVNNGGSYASSSPPAVTVYNSAGTSVGTGTTVLGTSITSVTISTGQGGSGYRQPPTVIFTSVGAGTGANATAAIAGPIDTITITNGGGSEYPGPPSIVSISANGTSVGTATISSGVTSVSVGTGGGSGYTTAPSVVFSGGAVGGNTAFAVAFISPAGGSVTSVSVIRPGVYSSTPSVSFSGGGGTGASATAIVNGYVFSITQTNHSSTFAPNPTITIPGGAISGLATATATISGSVTSVTFAGASDQGKGYPATTGVAFAGDCTSPASGTVVLPTSGWSVQSVVLADPYGTYGSGSTISFSSGGATASTNVYDNVVTVNHPNHQRSTGDIVFLNGLTGTGGLPPGILNGMFTVTVIDPNTYQVTVSQPAAETQGTGGGNGGTAVCQIGNDGAVGFKIETVLGFDFANNEIADGQYGYLIEPRNALDNYPADATLHELSIRGDKIRCATGIQFGIDNTSSADAAASIDDVTIMDCDIRYTAYGISTDSDNPNLLGVNNIKVLNNSFRCETTLEGPPIEGVPNHPAEGSTAGILICNWQNFLIEGNDIDSSVPITAYPLAPASGAASTGVIRGNNLNAAFDPLIGTTPILIKETGAVIRIENNYATPNNYPVTGTTTSGSWSWIGGTTASATVIADRNVIGYSSGTTPNGLYTGQVGDIIRNTAMGQGFEGWRCVSAGSAHWEPYGFNAALTVPAGGASAPAIGFTASGGGFYTASSGEVDIAFAGATTQRFTSAGGIVLGGTAPAIGTSSAGQALQINPSSGNTILGGGSTLAANSSAGFVLIPAISGSPAGGAPAGSTSGAAIVFDAANRKIWVYDPTSGWKSTVSATIP